MARLSAAAVAVATVAVAVAVLLPCALVAASPSFSSLEDPNPNLVVSPLYHQYQRHERQRSHDNVLRQQPQQKQRQTRQCPASFAAPPSSLPWRCRERSRISSSSSSCTRKFTSRSCSSSRSSSSRCLHMSIPNAFDTLTSGLASVLRMPAGVTVDSDRVATFTSLPTATTSTATGAATTTTTKTITLKQLYDVENCAACRKVRERITELDLVVERVLPAAAGSRVWNDKTCPYYLSPVEAADLPRLVVGITNSNSKNKKQQDDEDEEIILEGLDEILPWLEETFPSKPKSGKDKNGNSNSNMVVAAAAWEPLIAGLREVGNHMAGWMRLGRGNCVSPAAVLASPKLQQQGKQNNPFLVRHELQPLILYSYENNQFCRLVREVLTELDITYELRSCGKQSTRRVELAALTEDGSTQCPYLIDPNTGIQMAESKDIIQYLYDTYAKWTPPNELLQWTSTVILPLFQPLHHILTTSTMALATGSNSRAANDDDNNNNNKELYQQQEKEMDAALEQIRQVTSQHPVVMYTYDWSPFCTEACKVLDRLKIPYQQISLGLEWLPEVLFSTSTSSSSTENEKSAISSRATRAALMQLTGHSSLPHIFVGGKSMGGLFRGTPGLIPALEQDVFHKMVQEAMMQQEQQQDSTNDDSRNNNRSNKSQARGNDGKDSLPSFASFLRMDDDKPLAWNWEPVPAAAAALEFTMPAATAEEAATPLPTMESKIPKKASKKATLKLKDTTTTKAKEVKTKRKKRTVDTVAQSSSSFSSSAAEATADTLETVTKLPVTSSSSSSAPSLNGMETEQPPPLKPRATRGRPKGSKNKNQNNKTNSIQIPHGSLLSSEEKAETWTTSASASASLDAPPSATTFFAMQQPQQQQQQHGQPIDFDSLGAFE